MKNTELRYFKGFTNTPRPVNVNKGITSVVKNCARRQGTSVLFLGVLLSCCVTCPH